MQQKVSFQHRLMLTGLFLVFYMVLYQYPNLRPLWEPSVLHLTWIDRVVPLLPWSFLVYVSDYLLVLAPVLLIAERNLFYYFCRLAFGVLVISGLFFWFYPTIYLRPDYPTGGNSFIYMVMQFVRYADAPTNCFPSLHVGLTGAAAWVFRYKSKKMFAFFSFWAFLVFVSTLTTKQHYVIDIFGGLGVLLSVGRLEWYFYGRKQSSRFELPALVEK